jgi:site-specific DNA recombinase
LLNRFAFQEKYFKPFLIQIDRFFEVKMNDKNNGIMKIESKLSEIRTKKEKMERRFVIDGELTKEQFEKYSKNIDEEIGFWEQERNKYSTQISNQKNKIEKALKLSQNLSKIWVNGALELKRRLQNLVFPYGLVIDTQKRLLLTKNYNHFFELVLTLSDSSERKKKGSPDFDFRKSLPVAGMGVEPMTSGL